MPTDLIYIKDTSFLPNIIDIKLNTDIIFVNDDLESYVIVCNGCSTSIPLLSIQSKSKKTLKFEKIGKYEVTLQGFGDEKCIIEVINNERENIIKRNSTYFPTSKELKLMNESNLLNFNSIDIQHYEDMLVRKSNRKNNNNNNTRRSYSISSFDSDNNFDESESENMINERNALKLNSKQNKLKEIHHNLDSTNTTTSHRDILLRNKISEQSIDILSIDSNNNINNKSTQIAINNSTTTGGTIPTTSYLNTTIHHNEHYNITGIKLKLPPIKILIQAYSFQQVQIIAYVGQWIEFQLSQDVPQHAEHELQGISANKELCFESPLLQQIDCTSFMVCPSVSGDIEVSCKIYPEMKCSIQVVPAGSNLSNNNTNNNNVSDSINHHYLGKDKSQILGSPGRNYYYNNNTSNTNTNINNTNNNNNNINTLTPKRLAKRAAVEVYSSNRKQEVIFGMGTGLVSTDFPLSNNNNYHVDSKSGYYSESQSSFYDSDDVFSDVEMNSHLLLQSQQSVSHLENNAIESMHNNQLTSELYAHNTLDIFEKESFNEDVVITIFVDLQTYSFRPNNLFIKVGETVRFQTCFNGNSSGTSTDINSYYVDSTTLADMNILCDGLFYITPISLKSPHGKKYSKDLYFEYKFNIVGIFEVYSEIYSFMKCNIIVNMNKSNIHNTNKNVFPNNSSNKDLLKSQIIPSLRGSFIPANNEINPLVNKSTLNSNIFSYTSSITTTVTAAISTTTATLSIEDASDRSILNTTDPTASSSFTKQQQHINPGLFGSFTQPSISKHVDKSPHIKIDDNLITIEPASLSNIENKDVINNSDMLRIKIFPAIEEKNENIISSYLQNPNIIQSKILALVDFIEEFNSDEPESISITSEKILDVDHNDTSFISTIASKKKKKKKKKKVITKETKLTVDLAIQITETNSTIDISKSNELVKNNNQINNISKSNELVINNKQVDNISKSNELVVKTNQVSKSNQSINDILKSNVPLSKSNNDNNSDSHSNNNNNNNSNNYNSNNNNNNNNNKADNSKSTDHLHSTSIHSSTLLATSSNISGNIKTIAVSNTTTTSITSIKPTNTSITSIAIPVTIATIATTTTTVSSSSQVPITNNTPTKNTREINTQSYITPNAVRKASCNSTIVDNIIEENIISRGDESIKNKIIPIIKTSLYNETKSMNSKRLLALLHSNTPSYKSEIFSQPCALFSDNIIEVKATESINNDNTTSYLDNHHIQTVSLVSNSTYDKSKEQENKIEEFFMNRYNLIILKYEKGEKDILPNGRLVPIIQYSSYQTDSKIKYLRSESVHLSSNSNISSNTTNNNSITNSSSSSNSRLYKANDNDIKSNQRKLHKNTKKSYV